MKNLLTIIGSAMTAVGITLMSAGCGGKDDSADSGENGDGGSKDKSKTSAPADLEAGMIGYWEPNAEAMKKEMEKEMADNPNAAALAPMMEALIASMAVHIPKKGEVIIHVMGEEKPGTYELTKTDVATKTLTMRVTEDGETSEGTAMIDGDRLVLEKDGNTLDLNRIDEATFKKRLENAKLPVPGGEAPTPPPIPVPE